MPKQNIDCISYDSPLSNNNNDVNYQIVDKYEEKNTKITARKRWKILAKVLFNKNKDELDDISVRRFTSFGVFSPVTQYENWLEYSTQDNKLSMFVRHIHKSISARDLIGFNNTGNICVWPSEETLSLYVASNLKVFNNKCVIELGGGMSCLAGLVAAKYGQTKFVHVTDGNPKSVENVQNIIKYNNLQDKVHCSVLKWQDVKHNGANSIVLKKFDIILIADCLFFDEVREDLINVIWLYLCDGGVAYVMAPHRGNTLDTFISVSQKVGFTCRKIDKTDYWKSNEKKYCDFCKCWITDNKITITTHEGGKKHKENVARKISEINKKSLKDQKSQMKMDNEISKMERNAMAAYLKDIKDNADLTSQLINEKLTETNSTLTLKAVEATSSPQKTEVPSAGPSKHKPKKGLKWKQLRNDDGEMYYRNFETYESQSDPPTEGFIPLDTDGFKLSHFKEKKKPKDATVVDFRPAPIMGPQPKGDDPYGSWTVVEAPPSLDLQLPQQKPSVIAPVVAPVQVQEKKFKEKQIVKLEDDADCVGVEFKKRKINSSAKRNTRQRLDDD